MTYNINHANIKEWAKNYDGISLNTIYNEDCLKTMKRMPDGFVDLTVTSPPYDNLRTYNGYSFDFESIAKELYRVTKDGGVVVWVVGDATVSGSETGTSFRQALYFKEVGFNLHDTMIWRKKDPLPQTKVGRRYTLAHEYMFVFAKGRLSTFNPIMIPTKNAGKKANVGTQREADGTKRANRLEAMSNRVTMPTKPMQSVVEYPTGKSRKHPAVFPEKLAYDHIVSWSNENDTIYDCFMGSGTTAKVAKDLNRNYIGSEISKEYCDIAEARIKYWLEKEDKQVRLI